MKLTFDPEFDQGAWPGPLAGAAERGAVAGEEWAGEAGLLGRLETALGLGGPPIADAERAASIVPAVRERSGFWSASAAVDPLGTARRLLEWRDEMALGGWRGEAPASHTPWLAALAAVTQGAPVGVPDRLNAVAQSLARRGADFETVRLFSARDLLPPLWRNVLNALAGQGTRIEEVELADVAASGSDLHSARRADFVPRPDGSLQLVRAHGPLAAADGVASWLAAQADLSGVVIVGADTVLDAALHRHGLPTTGALAPGRENLLLQIVPLVLALAWFPADPQRALELLSLPLGPVPPAIARRLVRALHEWPAVDSDDWREALAAGLADIPEEARRQRVSARLATLLTPSVARGALSPAAGIERRLAALDAWLRGRRAVESDETSPLSRRWQAPRDQIAGARRLLAAGRFEALSAAQLQWLIETATASVAVPPPHPAQAGLAAVGGPGGIAGPARVVVWWRFLLDGAPRVRRLPLAPADRAALVAAGVQLPDPGRQALELAQRWRRPFLQAREHLLLIAPRRGDDGQEAFPHPLWDELAARATSEAALGTLVHARPKALSPLAIRSGISRPLPRPRRSWTAPSRFLSPRQQESPSSLASQLGCSLGWTLEHLAGLRAGETGPLPKDEQLSGSVAHRILATVLTAPEGARNPERAALEAERLFDELGPRLAASFFLPGADQTRAEARRVLGTAARAMADLLQSSGLRVLAAETSVVAADGPWKESLGGRPDLVLGTPSGQNLSILDLKWGGAPYRRASLEAGTALQLAAYSVMVRPSATAPLPAVAYFILKQMRLLTTEATAFPGAERVQGPDVAATWASFEMAYEKLWAALAGGHLLAPGNTDDGGEPWPEADVIEAGELVLKPPCNFCDLGALCGKVFAEGAG